MKTCKANSAKVGDFVEFEDRQMLVVDDETIHNAIKGWLAGEIDGVCTTYVTDMSNMFFYAKSFNRPIGDWDVSNVTDMSNMFFCADSFNQDISSWDVSNVTDMRNMFSFATSFNQDISSWDVSNVTNMSYMFYNADSFNETCLTKWDCYNVQEGRRWSEREE